MVDEIKKIHISEHQEQNAVKPKMKHKKVFKLKFILVPLLVILLIFGLTGIIIFFLVKPLIPSVQKTINLAKESYQAIKTQDLVMASDKLRQTEESLQESQKNYKKLSFLKIIPFVNSYYKDGEHAFNAGINGIEAGRILIDAVTPYADVLGFKGQGSFMGGTAEDRIIKIVQTLTKVTPKIDEVADKLDIVEKELEEINSNRYPKEIKGKKIQDNIIQIKSLVFELSSGVNEAKPILNVLPQILGYPNNKKYLVIFQNDGELRATGGFMTAWAILKVESGKIKSEKSDDIYSLDKKFKSRLKPPEPIKKYLFSTDLNTGIVPYYYLRDMNFSPDFKVSMDTFKENYDKLADEQKVDGIIAMDTAVLTNLVTILGPIEVNDYGKFTVEPDKRCHNIPNIICDLEYIIDQPLPTQGGNRKQTILGPMLQQILLKAMGSPKQIWPNLFSTSLKLLKEKHILLYFTDPKIQQSAEAFGAAGRIVDTQDDYLHISDSNFGGAKSDLFTKHEVEQVIEVDKDGKVTNTLTLIYENPESIDNCNLERKEGLCLNSILRDYVRIYVPKDSKLIENLGSEVAMETKEDLGKTYFDGFLTVRGGGGRAKLVVKYELPFKVKPGEKYRLLIQKQPGTLGHKYKVVFGDKTEEFNLITDKKLEFSF